MLYPSHPKIRSINFAEKQLLMRVAGVEILWEEINFTGLIFMNR